MKRHFMLIITLMLVGRAMTLAYIHRAGGSAAGDPPAAWLMPLIGDAIIGVSALLIAWLIWNRRGLWVWSSIVVWNAVAIWDAMAAYIIHLSNPWPDFFMIKTFGSAMFFAASAMHVLLLVLASQRDTRNYFMKNAD